mmetsp:Transcript_71417/g.209668  ORF Transcript_71417/g.209668 Transcript_71417/m.209668 type:complete len:318 (+) Transcript_71417:437-1390(+)
MQGQLREDRREERDVDLQGPCRRGEPQRRELQGELPQGAGLRAGRLRRQCRRKLLPERGAQHEGGVGQRQLQHEPLRRRCRGGRQGGGTAAALPNACPAEPELLLGGRGLRADSLLQRRGLRQGVLELRRVLVLQERRLLLQLQGRQASQGMGRHRAGRWPRAPRDRVRRPGGRLAWDVAVLLRGRLVGRACGQALLELGGGACEQHQGERRQPHGVRRSRLLRRRPDAEGRVGLLLEHRRLPGDLEGGQGEGFVEGVRLDCEGGRRRRLHTGPPEAAPRQAAGSRRVQGVSREHRLSFQVHGRLGDRDARGSGGVP